MKDLADAIAALQQELTPKSLSETIPLTQAAGRVLASQQLAPIAMPPFAASAMDGYAVRRADFAADQTNTFSLIGTSWAGHPFENAINTGQAVRVFTGAAIPAGADQVLLQEEVIKRDQNNVTFAEHSPGESYVRPIGHDFVQGQHLLEPGILLNGFHQGAL